MIGMTDHNEDGNSKKILNAAEAGFVEAGSVEASAGRDIDVSGNNVLRRLATRAMGLTGADIERIVREARLKARRQKRPMTYADVEAGIRGHRPPVPADQRWRLAIHESGHAVVHHALQLGAIKGISIDNPEGGSNTISFASGGSGTVEWYKRLLVLLMAGRAAELLLFEAASAGSGGAEHSDLGRATRIALDMEQTLGFGGKLPLLYLHHRDPTPVLSHNPDLAARVHLRLELAQARATEVIIKNRPVFDWLVRELFDAQVLDGEAVMAILTAAL
ncbi:cell division protease FtsH [Rhizobium leguminosarum]